MGKMYCGGEKNSGSEYEYIVYCYDPSRDEWTPLPPLPVKSFGLGEVNGKLVAVGGEKKSKNKNIISSEVHTYDNQQWEQTIPCMPTARSFPGVLSLQSALVVAGGIDPTGRLRWYCGFCTVEIFKLDTSQWYSTDPLPTACYNTSLVAIGNTCYALGGHSALPYVPLLNQALYASVDDLLGNAVPANQTSSHRGSSDTWKTLPNTPTYGPAATVLAGNLLAAGGDKKEMYLYSSETESWVYTGSLPCDSKEFGSIVSLSSLDILVIANGGNSVYKGTPTILKTIN